MHHIKGALRTFWSLLRHPLGTGSPIPLRDKGPKQLKLDSHIEAISGHDL